MAPQPFAAQPHCNGYIPVASSQCSNARTLMPHTRNCHCSPHNSPPRFPPCHTPTESRCDDDAYSPPKRIKRALRITLNFHQSSSLYNIYKQNGCAQCVSTMPCLNFRPRTAMLYETASQRDIRNASSSQSFSGRRCS